MSPWLQFALACVLPVSLLYLLINLPKLIRPITKRRIPPHPTTLPIERLVADLRRLSEEQDWVRRADVPARRSRLTAIELAYDDILLDCCTALGLDLPGTSPLSRRQRLDIEAALMRAGLRW